LGIKRNIHKRNTSRIFFIGDKMEIYLTGDTHGDITRLGSSHFPEGKSLSKEDLVIQLGDFGIIWDQADTANEKNWMESGIDCRQTSRLYR